MSYCSVDDVKLLLTFAVFKPNAQGGIQFDDPTIQKFIDRAGTYIQSDFSTKIDFSKVPQITDTIPPPFAIQDLTIFKTSELLLVALHGAQRSVETVTDVMYWQAEYKRLGDKIYKNQVVLQIPDGNGGIIDLYQAGQKFQNTDKYPPAFSDTKYGNWRGGQPDGFPDRSVGSLPASPF